MLHPVSPCSTTRTGRAPAPWQLTASNSQLPDPGADRRGERAGPRRGAAERRGDGRRARRGEAAGAVAASDLFIIVYFWPSTTDDSLSTLPPPVPLGQRGGGEEAPVSSRILRTKRFCRVGRAEDMLIFSQRFHCGAGRGRGRRAHAPPCAAARPDGEPVGGPVMPRLEPVGGPVIDGDHGVRK